MVWMRRWVQPQVAVWREVPRVYSTHSDMRTPRQRGALKPSGARRRRRDGRARTISERAAAARRARRDLPRRAAACACVPLGINGGLRSFADDPTYSIQLIHVWYAAIVALSIGVPPLRTYTSAASTAEYSERTVGSA